MSRTELEAKGIIISAAPQGEYGRRIKLITDRLGKITAFAGGAAKANSKLIGILRPMTSAKFTLAEGKAAYNIHGAEIIDAFDDLAFDFEASVYAAYVLETAEYFSEEGMPEQDAKNLLNLMFVTLRALRERKLSYILIAAVYELRLMVLQGEYTQLPPSRRAEETVEIWQRTISVPLTGLYADDYFRDKETTEFRTAAGLLFDRQAKHRFRALSMLKELPASDIKLSGAKAADSGSTESE